jgi:hypothetical protein
MDCIPAVPWNSLFVLVAAKSDNRSEKRTAPKGRLSIPQIAFLRRAIPKRPTRPLPNNQTGAGTGIVDTAYAQFTPESDDTLNAIGVPLSSITDWIPSQRSVLPKRAIHFTLVLVVSQLGREDGLSCRRSDDIVEDPHARLDEANGRTRAPERARHGG